MTTVGISKGQIGDVGPSSSEKQAFGNDETTSFTISLVCHKYEDKVNTNRSAAINIYGKCQG